MIKNITRQPFQFASHFNERIKKAKTTEFKIKRLSKTYNLCPRSVQKIQVVAVQSITLYEVVLWQKTQKHYPKNLQKLIN